MNTKVIELLPARPSQTIPATRSCPEDVETHVFSGPPYHPEPALAEQSQHATIENQFPCPAGDPLPSPVLEVPKPPRRADGKIDYEKIADDSLAELLKVFSQRRLAVLWETSRFTLAQEIARRRARQERDGTPGEDAFGCRPYQYDRPSKLKLFELLWEMPATHIARDIRCSQATILGWAKEDGIKGPGHRYWQRKKNGIQVEVPAEIKALYLKLRAEAAPEEQLREIPEAFRTTETQAAIELEAPIDMGEKAEAPAEPEKAGGLAPVVEPSNLKRRGPKPIILKISKADLLEQRWLKPATRVAEELKLSHTALLQKCREWGLGPFLPPEKYWASRKSGDPIVIPEEIQAVIAQLRAESVCAGEEAIVILGEQPAADLTDVDRCLSPVPAVTESGRDAFLRLWDVPLPDPGALGLRPRVGIGSLQSAFQRWRYGPSAGYSGITFQLQQLSWSTFNKYDVWAPMRAKPPPSGECVSFRQYIYVLGRTRGLVQSGQTEAGARQSICSWN